MKPVVRLVSPRAVVRRVGVVNFRVREGGRGWFCVMGTISNTKRSEAVCFVSDDSESSRHDGLPCS